MDLSGSTQSCKSETRPSSQARGSTGTLEPVTRRAHHQAQAAASVPVLQVRGALDPVHHLREPSGGKCYRLHFANKKIRAKI